MTKRFARVLAVLVLGAASWRVWAALEPSQALEQSLIAAEAADPAKSLQLADAAWQQSGAGASAQQGLRWRAAHLASRAALTLGQMDTALRYCTSAQQEAQTAQAHASALRARIDCALANSRVGRWDAAKAELEAILPKADGLKSPELIAQAHLGLVHWYRRKSQLVAAAPHAERALAAAEQSGDVHQLMQALEARARVVQAQDGAARAKPWVRRWALLAQRENSPRALATLAYFQSKMAVKSGQPQQALATMQAAVQRYGQVPDAGLAATLYHNLGETQIETGHYPQALEAGLRAVSLAAQSGNHTVHADALMATARAYRRMNRYREAMTLLQEAAALLSANEDWEGLAHCQNNLGALQQDLGLYAASAASFQAAVAAMERHGDQWSLGVFYNNLGSSQVALGDYLNAEASNQRALSIARAQKDDVGIAYALVDLGGIYRQQSRMPLAIATTQQAVDLLAQTGELPGTLNALVDLGQTYLADRQARAAEPEFAQAGALAESKKSLEEIWLSADGLMRSAQQQGKAALAIFHGKRAVNVLGSLRGDAYPLGPSARKGLRRRARGCYQTLVLLLMEQNRLSEAAQVMHALKGDELMDFSAAVPPALIKPLAYSRAERAALATWRHSVQRYGTDLGAVAATKRKQAQRGLAQAQKKIHQQLAASSHQSEQADFSTADGIAATTVRLSYVFAEQHLYWLLEHQQRRQSGKIDLASSGLEGALRQYLQRLRDPSRDPVPLAQQLYQTLLHPALAQLPERPRSLHIAADGLLRYLPFAALHDGEHWLAETTALHYQVPAVESAPQAASNKLVALGTVRGDDQHGPLPNVALELAGIVAASATKRPSELLLDQDFTAASLLRSVEGDAGLVHIATHFNLGSGSEAEAGLLLGNGEQLPLSRLRESPKDWRQLRLLSLSACNTAIDRTDADGRELDGLASTALSKGAQAVMASLWAVDDASTGLLMRAFYSALPEPAEDFAAALQTAQRQLIEQSGSESQLAASLRGSRAQTPAPSAATAPPATQNTLGYRHPYYWAPFIVLQRAPTTLAKAQAAPVNAGLPRPAAGSARSAPEPLPPQAGQTAAP